MKRQRIDKSSSNSIFFYEDYAECLLQILALHTKFVLQVAVMYVHTIFNPICFEVQFGCYTATCMYSLSMNIHGVHYICMSLILSPFTLPTLSKPSYDNLPSKRQTNIDVLEGI